jgi:hypothetical protein
MPNATQDYVAILGLFPGTGGRAAHYLANAKCLTNITDASNLVTKSIYTQTISGAPISVMCNILRCDFIAHTSIWLVTFRDSDLYVRFKFWGGLF